MSEAMQPGPLADLDILAVKLCLIQSAVEFVLHGIYSALVMIVLYKLCETVARLNYLIGDAIVVWRAWVLWTDHPRVHMLLCICLFGTFAGVTVDLAFTSLFALSQFSDTPRSPPNSLRLLILRLPVFLTNFISTVLTAYKVWEYRVEIKQNLGLSHNRKTKVERVLILLTESGSIYCLLWLSLLVFDLKSSDKESLAYAVIISTVPLLVAIYPVITILLLAFQKANLESTVNGPSFSQSLEFSSRPQVPTATQSDNVTADSTTSHIDSVMPDPATNDRLDPTTDNRPDSNTNDIAVAEKANLESTVAGPSCSQSLQFASRPQVPTVTQSDDVAPDSTTSHIDSVMPDPATDDRLDPTMYNRPNSKTNDIAVAESLGKNMEKHGSSHFG
ncbi:hypothetical protein C8J56DRAFT_1162636 [Mycena floridula]|nr:hypothetical protein C8J56DRAFT_1162636 [Mycena floridula]